MKITAIKPQLKRTDRYSVYVDGEYSFSLSESALLESRLASGQELDKAAVDSLKQLSADDKMYQRALRYAAMRPRSVWELTFYLQRHDCPAPLSEQITNKLEHLGMLNDLAFAEAFVRDRRLLRSASTRKLQLELRKKHVSDEVITRVLAEDTTDESTLLVELIAKKRRQTRYQDTEKLMQYLARQGFSYGDIKSALEQPEF